MDNNIENQITDEQEAKLKALLAKREKAREKYRKLRADPEKYAKLLEYHRAYDAKQKTSNPEYKKRKHASYALWYETKGRENKKKKVPVKYSDLTDKQKQDMRKYGKNWRKRNPEKVQELQKRSYIKNREKRLQQCKERYAARKAKLTQQQQGEIKNDF